MSLIDDAAINLILTSQIAPRNFFNVTRGVLTPPNEVNFFSNSIDLLEGIITGQITGSNLSLSQSPIYDFTQEDLHGLKQNSANKVPNTHTIDRNVVIGLQTISNYSKLIFPGGVPIQVNSTKRTEVYNANLGGSEGPGAPHVLGIAIDWKFTGPNALSATKKFNTDIRDKGPLYQQLRKVGVHSFGLYGPKSSFGKNFCHIDSRNLDTPKLSRIHLDSTNGNFAFWEIGGPLYNDSVEQVVFDDKDKAVEAPVSNECIKSISTKKGLSTGQEIYMKDRVADSVSYLNSDITAEQILNYTYQGLTNRERIYKALSTADKIKYTGNSEGTFDPTKDYPFEVGTVFYIPCDFIRSSQSKGSSISTQSTDSAPRAGDNVTIGARMTQSHTNQSIPYPPLWAAVTQDPGFKRSDKDRTSQHTDTYPQLTVYGWSRVLHKLGLPPLLDLTADIISITTSSEMASGGSFSIEIAPVYTTFDGNMWVKRGAVSRPDSGLSINLSTIGLRVDRDETATQNIKDDDNTWQDTAVGAFTIAAHSDMYYDILFQQNDPIFIKFEQLDIDKAAQKGVLADQWYDMMALVDHITVSRNAQGTAVSVVISGRDYQKVLMDESGYSNPYSVGGVGSMFGDQVDLVAPRSFSGGIYDYKTVDLLALNKIMEFALYGLISNEFCPSSIFEDNWPSEDLNDIYIHSESGGLFSEREKLENTGNPTTRYYTLRGVWQKIKMWIDPQIADYVVWDDSVSSPDGPIWGHFQKICQQPFVEVFTETVGDWFYIIVRRPPFTRRSYFRAIDSAKRSATNIDESTNTYRQWKDVFNKLKPTDPSTSEEVNTYLYNNELLLNIEDYYAKISEEQVKNFTSLNFREQLKELGTLDSEVNSFPAIVHINSRDVLSESLAFSTEAYSWFEIDTRGTYSETGGPYGFPIPAVYFNEMAQIFGSKRLSISTNYVSLFSIRDGGDSAVKKQQLMEEQVAQLLGYVIETHIYLPFTREGSITIAGGDRRIKKGTFIYHQPTDELFYVTNVTHQLAHSNNAINRSTTITVSRGMRSTYIKGREEVVTDNEGNQSEQHVSYFDIVDLPVIQQQIIDAAADISLDTYDQKKPAKINAGVLNFFLSKRQFAK